MRIDFTGSMSMSRFVPVPPRTLSSCVMANLGDSDVASRCTPPPRRRDARAATADLRGCSHGLLRLSFRPPSEPDQRRAESHRKRVLERVEKAAEPAGHDGVVDDHLARHVTQDATPNPDDPGEPV